MEPAITRSKYCSNPRSADSAGFGGGAPVCAAYSTSAWRAAAAPMMRAATVSRSPTFAVMAVQAGRGPLGGNEGARRQTLLQRHAAQRRDHQHDTHVQRQRQHRARADRTQRRIVRQRVRQQRTEHARRRDRRRCEYAPRHQVRQEQQDSPSKKPPSIPQKTPLRLAPLQYSAARTPGANCATAANASNPIAARFVDPEVER